MNGLAIARYAAPEAVREAVVDNRHQAVKVEVADRDALAIGSPVASVRAKVTGGDRPQRGRIALRLASLLLFVALWQIASHYRLHLGIVTFQNVPAPSEVVPALWELLQSPKVLHHIGNSLYRVFGGFAHDGNRVDEKNIVWREFLPGIS